MFTTSTPSGEVRSYWTDRYDKLSSKMQAVFREPILSRISSFIADSQIRDIVGQQKSTFSFTQAMQRGLWVILNLSVGRLGENSAILGSMLFTKLELDIMSLAHVPEKERRLFSVYADELQNPARQPTRWHDRILFEQPEGQQHDEADHHGVSHRDLDRRS